MICRSFHTATVTSPISSLAGTLAAPPVISSVPAPPPVVPLGITKSYEELVGRFCAFGVAEPIGLEALSATQSSVLRSLRYKFLVRKNQEVKKALSTVFEENSKTL